MRGVVLALCIIAIAIGSRAQAAEPSGCDKFAWDIQAEQRLLAGARTTPSGSDLPGTLPVAVQIDLQPFETAKLARPPERAPKVPSSGAGYVTMAVPQGGLYKVTLSGEGWIDVVQDGGVLKPEAFSGVLDCPNVRKTVRFRLKPGPVTVQISGSSSTSIGVAITKAD